MIGWNPLGTAELLRRGALTDRLVAFDLLDDWSIHPAFEIIRNEVVEAYRIIAEKAAVLTANSEATATLAAELGRDDVVMIPNGCDPESFAGADRRSGPVTVGYGGKLGSRVDEALCIETATALPEVRFEFAGPILDRGWGSRLRGLENVSFLGDVPYDRYPEVVGAWDIGWVPHRVGDGEVGGDAIKIYEYRAAGLPVFTTPIIGSDRAPEGVRVRHRSEITAAIEALVRSTPPDGRVPREPTPLPDDVRWESKARRVLTLIEGASR